MSNLAHYLYKIKGVIQEKNVNHEISLPTVSITFIFRNCKITTFYIVYVNIFLIASITINFDKYWEFY